MRYAGQILIVDDDPCVANVLAAYAAKLGHSPVLAQDGPEALMKAATLAPDVILLDVCMPKLDGRDVCCELKRNPETADVPVIIFSVRGDDPYLRRQVFELGAFDVFAKPVCLTALFERVEEALRPPMAAVSNY